MDENKLKVLKDINYKIGPVCGLCKHGEFTADMWGTCAEHKYSHLKHTGEKRDLSIHRYGHCKNGFRLGSTRADSLQKFREFLETGL